MIRRLVSVGGFTVLSRVAGFFRDVLMAAALGAGPISDAFMVAFRLPNNFRAVFAEGAFSAAFLPRYAASATKNGIASSSAASRFANEVFAWQFCAQIVLLVLALIFMRPVVLALAPGFAGDQARLDLAVELTRVTFPYLICMAIVTQMSVMLNAVGKFKAAAGAPILLNLAMIATLLGVQFFPTAAHAAACGVLLGGFLQLFFIMYAAGRTGLRLKLNRPRWRPEIKNFLKALGAATIGAGGVQIGLFMDTIIASFLPAGDLTALYYADRINQLPMGVIGVALGTVLLPEMSSLLAKSDERGASRAQNRAITLGLLLTLPFAIAFLILPDTVMRAVFARGAFDAAAAATAASALSAYCVGLPAFILVRTIVPSFYARGDTATPVRATLLSVAANIGLKILLVWGAGWGVVGVALGTALGAWVNVAMLIYLARRRSILVATPELKGAVLPVLICVLVAGFGFFLGREAGQVLLTGALRDEGTVLLAILLGGSFYAGAVFIFRKRLPLGARLSGQA